MKIVLAGLGDTRPAKASEIGVDYVICSTDCGGRTSDICCSEHTGALIPIIGCATA